MSFFDSLTHSMTTIATGGFSNYNESIGFFNSASIETSAMIFIILGSFPFIAYIKFLNGNREILFKDIQIKTFLKIIIISIAILSIYLIITDTDLFNFRAFKIVSNKKGCLSSFQFIFLTIFDGNNL